MEEIKIFGRGGQGAVTAAQILATAAFLEGHWAQTFPQFGAERRGARVIAYVRLDNKPIAMRNKVYSPDVVIVMDVNLFKVSNPLIDIKSGGTAIINCPSQAQLSPLLLDNVGNLFTMDATAIAHQLYGRTTIPITNLVLLGVYCAARPTVSLESVCEAVSDFFPSDKIDVNRKAAQMGFKSLRGSS